MKKILILLIFLIPFFGYSQSKITKISTDRPTVTDDIDNGYYDGVLWLKTSSEFGETGSGDTLFICKDATPGAAVWQFVTTMDNSGATTFLGLTDAPASYSGEGGKLVAVNTGETAVEFVSPSTSYSWDYEQSSNEIEITDGDNVQFVGGDGINFFTRSLAAGGAQLTATASQDDQWFDYSVIWNSGWEYYITAGYFFKNGEYYSTTDTTLTLDAAHATLDRIDVFAVDTNEVVVKLTGTPAADPVKPSVDSESQLELTFVYVAATETEPSVTQELVYDEDAEWTSSSVGVTDVTVDFTSTVSPQTGTYCLEIEPDASGSISGGNAAFTDSGKHGTSDKTLSFYMRTSAEWSKRTAVVITFLEGSSRIGGVRIGLKTEMYGFDHTSTDWQRIGINFDDMNILSDSLDKITIYAYNFKDLCHLSFDYIEIQDMASPPSTIYNLLTQNNIPRISWSIPNNDAADITNAGFYNVVTTTDNMPSASVQGSLLAMRKSDGELQFIFLDESDDGMFVSSDLGTTWTEIGGGGGGDMSYSDTAAMLLPYITRADTAAMLTYINTDISDLQDTVALHLDTLQALRVDVNAGGGSSSTESVDLIIIAGQSNAVGYAPIGDVPAYLSGDMPAYVYNGTGYEVLNATVDNNNQYGDPVSKWGLEMQLGYQYGLLNSDSLYIMKYAIGNTYLAIQAGDDWNTASSGEYYDNLKDHIDSAKIFITRDLGKDVNVVGFVWYQGENDMTNETYANTYYTNLTNFIEGIRTHIGIENLPIIEVRPDPTSAGALAYKEGVHESIDSVVNEQPNVRVISPNHLLWGYEAGDVHISGLSQIRLGNTVLEYITDDYVINPLTTFGDIIVADTNGYPLRLPIGSEGYVMTVTDGYPSWASGGGGSSPTGLEKITEGSYPGWALVGRTAANYGALGDSAVDLSLNDAASTTLGAVGDYSFAAGFRNKAFKYSAVFGFNNVETTATGLWGYNFMAGRDNTISAGGEGSVAFGVNNQVGDFSFVAGNSNTVTGGNSFSIGLDNESTGNYSASFGRGTTASGGYSLVAGYNSTASGDYSFASGLNSTASGDKSVSFGGTASGIYSFTGGSNSKSTANWAFAYGNTAEANGENSFSHGYQVYANGAYSYAAGIGDGINRYIKADGIASFVHSRASTRHVDTDGDYSAILGGVDGQLSAAADRSVMLGGSGMTGTQPDMVYVPAIKLDTISTAPTSPEKGTIYFDIDDNHFYGWNGTSWVQLDN